ncbi:hypothetical protein HPP92_023039 [Vanilla planifolia]|uniref:U-box domain-containing protein n=1 Tax=Vanilla planifolia TaxID=51239 RepID=A0A835UDR7_VANPL|nr:hypothetical protein HPP92_023039 [Vanilla planifolia]
MEVTMGVLTNLRDDALTRAVDAITELIEASETIKQKEDYIMRFSEQMIYVKDLLVKLKPHQSMAADSDFSSDSILRSLLERVETEFNKAREVVNQYRASRCPRIFLYRSVLDKLEQSSKEIYHILRLLNFAQLNYALNINAKAKAIYGKSKERKRASKDGDLAEQVVEQKYELVSEPVDERLHNHIFAETSNSGSSSPSPRTSPSSPSPRTSFDEIGIPPYYFFCTLTRKLMEDPVYVPCGHIFEREAIEDYFSQGKKLCHLCKEELSSTEILELTPNIWLRNFILEWKEKNAQIMADLNARKKLADLSRRITKEDMKSTNDALQEMQVLMIETPCCIKETTGSSSNLIGKLTDLLKYKEANTIAVLGCLLRIARFSDGNKVSNCRARS